MVGVDQAGAEMNRIVAFGAVLVAVCVGLTVETRQQPFRSRTDVVLVPVSVMKGRAPVTGLKAADFEITDNGVRQTVDEIASDQVPIDVTLVVTGRSADRNVEHARSLVSAEETRKHLQPADRLRMVWVTDEVTGSLVGADYRVSTDPAARRLGTGKATARGVVFSGDQADTRSGFGIALADGLFYALAWPVDSDRRHLVVVFTDGWDTASTMEMDALPKLAARSDAVLHAVLWVAPGEDSRSGGGINYVGRLGDVPQRSWQESYDKLDTIVRRTGGTMQRTSKAPEALADVIADFRSSYVLRYSPRGVAPAGWHELVVKVTKAGSFKLRARKGYEGG
jgi:VWFA-related protein